MQENERVESLLQRGLNHYGLSEVDLAIRCWRQVLSINPENTTALEYLSIVGPEGKKNTKGNGEEARQGLLSASAVLPAFQPDSELATEEETGKTPSDFFDQNVQDRPRERLGNIEGPIAPSRSAPPPETNLDGEQRDRPFGSHHIEEEFMSKLSEICESVVNDVGDAQAVGVVDLNTGMLMAVHHLVPYFTQSYLDAVAAAAVELFRGKMVRRVEQLLSKHRGKEVKDTFHEIFINSTMVFHFMIAIPEKSAVVVMVTKKTTNQGMGWASLRNVIGDIKGALP